MSKFKIYTKSILIPVIIGGISSLLISKFIDYNTLSKPFLAPPGILFPIIWTILYILMGISYGILESKSLTDFSVTAIYFIQLIVNALWPIFFFIFKWRLFSFLWILFLDVLIITMIVNFFRKNKLAGLLQIPYLIWSLFASYLTLGVYLLNR